MPSKNKKRGYSHEVRVKNLLIKYGYEVKQAWGSDGRALGLSSDVDLVATKKRNTVYIQCKKMQRIPKSYFSKPIVNYSDVESDYIMVNMTTFQEYELSSIQKSLVPPSSCDFVAFAGNNTPIYFIYRNYHANA